MEKPAVYKKKAITEVQSRQTQTLSVEEKTKVTQTINKFFELFIKKHVS
jgi:hypothetical protein